MPKLRSQNLGTMTAVQELRDGKWKDIATFTGGHGRQHATDAEAFISARTPDTPKEDIAHGDSQGPQEGEAGGSGQGNSRAGGEAAARVAPGANTTATDNTTAASGTPAAAKARGKAKG